jgi:hypothetical protein
MASLWDRRTFNPDGGAPEDVGRTNGMRAARQGGHLARSPGKACALAAMGPAHLEIAGEARSSQIFAWHVDDRLSVRQIALRLTESPSAATGRTRWDRDGRPPAPISQWRVLQLPRIADGDAKTAGRRRRTKSRSRCRPVRVGPAERATDPQRGAVPPLQAHHVVNTRQPAPPESDHYLPEAWSAAACAILELLSPCGGDGTSITTTLLGTRRTGRARESAGARSAPSRHELDNGLARVRRHPSRLH